MTRLIVRGSTSLASDLVKTIRNLFPRLCDPDELDAAARLAVRGKRRRPDVAAFLLRREAILAEIRDSLLQESWRPAPFETLYLRDPKPRVIARAPFRDRVVHTALTRLLEPTFLRSATGDSFACRRGFGTHRAFLRILELARRHRFAVHLDVRSYFPSVDLAVLRGLLARRVRDERFLAVVDRVLRSGAGIHDSPSARRHGRIDADWPPAGGGLPIGALTSQLFAGHVYLLEFDHWVKRVLHVPGYVRYMDDLVIFGDRRADVRAWRREVGVWLGEERRLRLKKPHARVLSCAGHLDVLGHRVRRGGIAPFPRQPYRRIAARTARYVREPAGSRRVDLERSLASSLGNVFFGC